MSAEYEYVAWHRNVGETELKHGREIREDGNLVHVDKTERILEFWQYEVGIWMW